MANVLTDTLHRAHTQAQLAQVLITTAGAFSFAALVIALALLPAYIRASAAAEAARYGAATAAENNKADRAALIAARKRIAALEDIARQPRTVELIGAVVKSAPLGVSLTSIHYAHKADETTLSLSGSATRRQSGQEYVRVLQTTGLFSSVSIPLTSLARAEDGSFQIATVVTENKEGI
ncbi:MAG: hypothetical protein KBE09_05310 [Candidatus Pacebacteria bacterium]|nr:hypothetical protein [Candidatus Paceibacterota bacterium]